MIDDYPMHALRACNKAGRASEDWRKLTTDEMYHMIDYWQWWQRNPRTDGSPIKPADEIAFWQDKIDRRLGLRGWLLRVFS